MAKISGALRAHGVGVVLAAVGDLVRGPTLDQVVRVAVVRLRWRRALVVWLSRRRLGERGRDARAIEPMSRTRVAPVVVRGRGGRSAVAGGRGRGRGRLPALVPALVTRRGMPGAAVGQGALLARHARVAALGGAPAAFD